MEAEALLVSAIAAEVNPSTGKAVFSNAEARAAELVNRKRQNVEYLAADQAAKDAEMRLNTEQFKLEQLQDQFKAYRYVVDLTARELALLAAGIADDQEEGKDQPF